MQTTVSDLTEELEGGSILFRDYDVYASKVLFADSSHPVLAPPVIMVKYMCPSIEFILLFLYGGSYTSVHVLLNLLNELGKRDEMRGLSSILSLFRNDFNKFNNTRAQMLDSIYHMTLSIL